MATRQKSQLTIATCQLPVSANINRNAAAIETQIVAGAQQGAEVIHFPECALSGYAGVDFCDWSGFNWNLLADHTRRIATLAKAHRVWLLLGSTHPLKKHLPHNCVYVINPSGKIVDRYDKRFCTDKDLRFYSPGNYSCHFQIRRINCAVTICHDVRYPELFRHHKQSGVSCVFQSFYNARAAGKTDHSVIMHPTIQGHCGSNHMWSSVANACGFYQSWPSCFVVPDGSITGKLHQHRSGVLVSTLNLKEQYRDASTFRNNAMRGILHSGKVVKEARSQDRKCL